MQSPLVSVIVPTKNSETTLSKCLESINKQTYKPIELIVVDNYSSDATEEISRQHGAKYIQKGPERSAQVNYAVSLATGEYVYKVDSDFILDYEVIEQCVKKIDEGYDAVVVHNSPDIRISWIAKIRKFEVDMYKYDLQHSSARFLKKSVYEDIKGFNESITAGEDFDFQLRLNRRGYKTGFIDAEALHIGEPTSILKHMMKYYEYSRNDFATYKKENKELSDQLFTFFNVYLRNWRKFLYQPLLGFGFILYTVSKFTFAFAGYVQSQVFGRNNKHDV